MGLGIFRWKILLIVVSVILLWQSSKVWLSFTQEKSSVEVQLQDNQLVTLSQKDEWSKQKVHIAVYYETLCPDSRSFFIKQLLPTYHKLLDNVQVELIPYGKATTTKIENGYEFMCQHGSIECEGNMIHACSIDILKNSSMQLEYLSCMIKNNIEPCFIEEKSKELLAKYGEQTNALVPSVSFIPTVTLDGNSENQARILKNLLQEVCLHFKILPEGCIL